MGRVKSLNVSSSKEHSTLSHETKSSLKELHKMVKFLHEERERSEGNLLNIQKTHERIMQEVKVSAYFKHKLKSLCITSIQDAENEVSLIKQVLDKITEIKNFKQNGSQSTSTSSGVNGGKKQIMRKGVLMNSLHQDASCLPVWQGRSDERPPPLCGSIPCDSTHVAKKGDKVAARVKGEEENWILAEVVSYQGGFYEVDDVDADEGNQRHTLSRRRVVPLPIWKANPLTNPEALFPLNTLVMALYPQTTCFYRALIHQQPKKVAEDYWVLFEDTSYPDGYSPPLSVPQKYVILCKQSTS